MSYFIIIVLFSFRNIQVLIDVGNFSVNCIIKLPADKIRLYAVWWLGCGPAALYPWSFN